MNDAKKMCPICIRRTVDLDKKFCSKECYLTSVRKTVTRKREEEINGKGLNVFVGILILLVVVLAPLFWLYVKASVNDGMFYYRMLSVCLMYSAIGWTAVFIMILRYFNKQQK